MTVYGPIEYYPGRTRRRRLLDAHGRIAACWSNPNFSFFDRRLGTRSLAKAGLSDGKGESASLLNVDGLDSEIVTLSNQIRENDESNRISLVLEEKPHLVERIDTIVLKTPPLELPPFNGLRFYLCRDLPPYLRSTFKDWILLQGAVFVPEFQSNSVDFIIGDQNPPVGSFNVAIRSPSWLMSLQKIADSSDISRGDLRNEGIRAIISVFQELSESLILVGQHYSAHAYAQVMAAVMQYYEDSASDDAALDEASFLVSALKGSADVVAAAKTLLSRRSPASLLHQLRSDTRLVAITALTKKISVSVSLARRLLRRRPDPVDYLQYLSDKQRGLFAIQPRRISAFEAESLIEHLQSCLPPNCIVVGCGAYRRRCDWIMILPIVISIESDDLSLDDIERHLFVKLEISRHQQHCHVIVENDIRVQIQIVPWAWRHAAVLVATGSDEFVRRFRWRARELGYLFTNDYRILRLASHITPTMPVESQFESEHDLFRLVGLDYIAPRWRLAFPLKSTHANPPEPIMKPAAANHFWRAKRAFVGGQT